MNYGRIPFADEQLLPPSDRPPPKFVIELDLHSDVATPSFYIARDRAFAPQMDLERIIPFLKQYSIPFAPPHHNQQPNIEFWAMCYAAVLCSHCGGESSVTRAIIWFGNKGHVWCYQKTNSYRIGRMAYTLHPLLSRKPPKCH